MIIKDITAHTVYTDYKEPWQHDNRFYVKTGQQANTIIIVHTDTDIIGIGEATHCPGLYGETPKSTEGALDMVRQYIIGKPALNRNLVLNIVDRVMPLGNLAFISALDQALLDIAGKAYGLPVVDLLGGRAHDSLPTHINPPTNENFIPILEQFLKEGYRVFKIKMSGDTPYDLDMVSSALKIVDEDVTLSLDANQGWNVPQALSIAAQIEADPHYRNNVILEQPVHASDFEGMARIRRGTRLKLMADDCIRTVGDLARLIKLEAADIVSIKISRCGGIRKCQQMVAMAEAANMLYIIDEINEMRVANTAVAHLALSTKSPLYTGVTCHLLLQDDIVLEGGVRIENGKAVIGNEPGLGIGKVNLQN